MMSGFLKKILFIYFLESEEGKEKERERNINVWLPLERPLLGTWPATQAYALTRNWTGHPLFCRPVLNPLSYTSPGWWVVFFFFNLFIYFRERKVGGEEKKTETSICWATYLYIHWLILVCALIEGLNPQTWHIDWGSNPQSRCMGTTL